ncbi:putative isomerase YddE [Anatilimnocola aggregata]|uniref:Putative isomerase YddE n=1 Tax=Anatilimnocola aggregata TaxID=2528021 RepID=A0A517YHE7_9BACT|nr:PhzF family phenazine biosynthesis protein [Anatilimnocola aggregata]QDU29642.1 putative isomerase YddE [Anatilimnocola aggregata]
MARIPCWQVDAFTNRPFGGNPAAVCWLEQQADAQWMQAMAAEMNLAETAFVRKLDEGYELRWFTPTVEVDLCGHATLASAHALWQAGLIPDAEPTHFHTRSGVLTCQRTGEWIELDFPATPAVAATAPPILAEALGAQPVYVAKSKFDYVAVYDSATTVRILRPDFRALGTIPVRGVIVTSISDDPAFDFIARFFGPASGIDEDPATGSAYCSLLPYWAERLGKTECRAYQASQRGGVLKLRLNGDRVILGGQAVTIWQGELLQ